MDVSTSSSLGESKIFHCNAFVEGHSLYLTEVEILENHREYRGFQHVRDAIRVVHPGLHVTLKTSKAARFGHDFSAFAKVVACGRFIETPSEEYFGELRDVSKFHVLSNGTDSLDIEVDLEQTDKLDQALVEKFRSDMDARTFESVIEKMRKERQRY